MNIIHGQSFGSSVGWTSSSRHPSPHKGILIFNGPIGIPFEERNTTILHRNQISFAEKRSFCVISIGDLAELMNKNKNEILSTLLMTVGEYTSA